MAPVNHQRANRQHGSAHERPIPATQPRRKRNGTGGVPPIGPGSAIAMRSWRRVAEVYDPTAKHPAVTSKTPPSAPAAPGDQQSASETESLLVEHAEGAANGEHANGETREPATLTGRTARQPILPRQPAGKLTNTPTTEPSPATKKPIIIAGARSAKHAKTTKRSETATSATTPPPPAQDRAPGGARRWPRSKAARAVAFVAIAATLFAALAATTPVGMGGGLNSALQAYANAAPWSAPPAPTTAANPPVAPGANPGKQAIIADIQAVFGPYAAGALNISRCESGYDPTAWNPIPILGSHASGVFQILYPSTWNGTSYRNYSPYNSWANIRAAYEIFKRDGYTWREWACRP